MIEVKNLTAFYEKSERIIFDDISFKLTNDSLSALCGKNGSGKSTLLLLMAGIVPAGLKVRGDILIDGHSVFKMKREEAAKNVSLLLQNETPVWNLTVRQFVETGLYAFGKQPRDLADGAVDEALSSLGILDFADKLIFNISGGEFQKCRLARCLIQKSPAMLFDEPAENLDMPFQMQFLNKIRELSENKIILFSIHDINTAALFATDFLLLSKGKIIQAKRDEIFKPEILSDAFDADVKIFEHPLQGIPQVIFN